jgi:L-2-hydroxyglutarate oxidase
MRSYGAVIIGAGILGLATAWNLLKKAPHLKLAILDKEDRPASHQTGHNSGVIHSGIYYKPGSLKAENCRKGVKQLYNYLNEKGIPYEQCGKLIIAKSPQELPALKELERRGLANGVPGLKMIQKEEIAQYEPHCAGIAALHSPETSIVDYVRVATSYLEDIRNAGADLFFNQELKNTEERPEGIILKTTSEEFCAKQAINCAGFYADKVAHLSDAAISKKQIIPFRGEYYELKPEKRQLVKGLIYPVPNPEFPFLGVHLSKTIEGRVEAGPNAVLAFCREGYRKRDVSLQSLWDYVSYSGFWNMASKYWKVGIYELYRSYSKKSFLKSLQTLVPELVEEDLIPAESGVRSQIVLPNGKLQDDFLIVERPRWVHVLNAPSPAATASLAIGETIASLVHV